MDLVPSGRLLVRLLQLHRLRFFTPLVDPRDKLVPLSPEIKVLCRAWASPSRLFEGIPFAPPPPFLVFTTDASGLGWGTVLHPHRVSGVWSKEEAFDFINSLELKTVLLDFAEPRISCGGSFDSDSFRHHDGGILFQSSGRNSFLIPVSAGLGPVGMVSFV